MLPKLICGFNEIPNPIPNKDSEKNDSKMHTEKQRAKNKQAASEEEQNRDLVLLDMRVLMWVLINE